MENIHSKCSSVKVELQDRVTSGVTAIENYVQQVKDRCTKQNTDKQEELSVYHRHTEVSKGMLPVGRWSLLNY